MKAFLHRLKQQHWDRREPREQRTLLIGLLLAGPVFVYLLLWEPAATATTELEQQLPVLQTQAAQLKADAMQVEALRHATKPVLLDTHTLKAAIADTAAEFNLDDKLTQLEAEGNARIRIMTEPVSFSTWVSFLRQLQQTQHVRTESATISAAAAPGMVRISCVLTNGGGS